MLIMNSIYTIVWALNSTFHTKAPAKNLSIGVFLEKFYDGIGKKKKKKDKI